MGGGRGQGLGAGVRGSGLGSLSASELQVLGWAAPGLDGRGARPHTGFGGYILLALELLLWIY